jgi:PAS domain S-box-containing protein
LHSILLAISGVGLSPWTGSDIGIANRRVRVATRLLGWLLAVVGVAGVADWWLAHGRLSQPVASFPPVSLIESLGILIIGLGLVAATEGLRRGVALGGLATIGLGLMALGHQLFAAAPIAIVPGPGTGTTLIPLTLPVSSALLFIFGGAGLIGLSLPARTDRSRLIAGAFGAIEAVLCLGILTTRLMWRPDAQGNLLVGSSFHLLMATLLLGLCLGLITWSSDPETASTPWVPLAVGIACLVTAIFLWRALVTYEQVQIREQTQAAARAARIQIGRQVEAATKVLTRIARFTPAPWRSTAEQENTAVSLTRDVDGLHGIAWADSMLVVRQIQPSTVDSEPLRGELGRRLHEVLQAQPPGQASEVAKFFPLDQAGRFAIALPYCGQRRCAGYVIGVFEAEHLLAPAVSDSGSGFVFAVAGQRRDILRPPGRATAPADWTDRSTYAIGQLVWDISTWPSEQTLARQRSGLPEMLLLLGLVVSTLLPLAIRLGQLNLTRARLAERVRVNLALETATDGIWEWDVATATARRSSSLWRHLGYDPGAMSTGPDPWISLIHPTDRPRVLDALSDHLSGLSPTFEARYRIKGRAEDWHWVIDRGRVVERSPSGQPRRVLGISADVTDRQRADEALAASERRFRACFDSANQLQLLLDSEGRTLEANRAALEFIGLELHAIRGRSFWDLPCWQYLGNQVDDQAARIHADVTTALGGTAVRREMELESAESEALILELSISAIHDSGGQVTQLLVDGRDLTVRKRAEDVLREVESLTTMGRMAARVAHEINNPLAGIQNAFLLIKDAVPANHPHRSYVGAVEREISRIAGVTRQLYETYRPEQNGTHGTSVSGLVSDAVALLEQVNRASGVRIDVDLTGLPATVRLPEAILRQSLYNLVQNAVEASPPGGLVEVAATVEDGDFVLKVRDRGPGIPAEIRERVFEPFFTTKPATVRTGGMGLGLSLVGRSVQALGGHVDIHDRDGGGTEFVVRLPIPAVPTEVTA